MIPEIDLTTFAGRLAEDDALVTGVREVREYRPGHGSRCLRDHSPQGDIR